MNESYIVPFAGISFPSSSFCRAVNLRHERGNRKGGGMLKLKVSKGGKKECVAFCGLDDYFPPSQSVKMCSLIANRPPRHTIR